MRLLVAFSALLSLAAAQNMVVQVGSTASSPGGIFQFIPPSFNATNGTTITFRYTGAPGNHSVTQSTFSDPCDPTPGGFDSGWVFIPPSNVSETPEWNLTITNDTKPIWFFCKQLVPSPHCAAGMVGAINAPTTGKNTFAAFQAAAKAFSGVSGQGEGGLVGIGASASAAPSPIAGGASLVTGAPVATSTSPSGSGSASSASASTSSPSSSAMHSGVASSLILLLAAAVGVNLPN